MNEFITALLDECRTMGYPAIVEDTTDAYGPGAKLTLFLGDGRALVTLSVDPRSLSYSIRTPVLGDDIELVNLRNSVFNRLATVHNVTAAADRLRDAVEDQIKWSLGRVHRGEASSHREGVVTASKFFYDAVAHLEQRRRESWK